MNLRILHLEDSPNDSELTLAELVQQWPDLKMLRVETQAEFEGALENNPYDIILADYNLPQFDGLSALKIANKKYSHIPFIFLSGAMGEESAIETLKLGATDFVIKGRLFRLIPAIKRALDEADQFHKRVHAEEEVRKSEARYKKLVESLTDYIFTVELKMGVPFKTIHGPGCKGVTGYSAEEYEKNSNLWLEMVYPDDLEAVKKQAGDILSGKFEPLEHRIIQKNGTVIWVKNVIVPRYDENGVMLSYDGLISNITQRKYSEEKMMQEVEITGHLLMIAEATSQITDIHQLLKKVISCTLEILHCNYVFSYTYQKETNSYRPVELIGLSTNLYAKFMSMLLNAETSWISDCLQKNQPVILNKSDLINDKISVFDYLGEFRFIAILPLMARKNQLGMVLLFFQNEKIFTDREIKIMQGIAHQTSLAVDQARLYRDSMERTMELSAQLETIQVMNEIDRSILSTLDDQEILESVTHLVSRLIPCDRATVAIVDNEKSGFIFQAGFGMDFLEKGQLIGFGQTSTTEILETGKVEYTANLGTVSTRLPLEEKLFQAGFRSHIRVPLYVKGSIAAVLNVGSRRASAFTVENLSTVEKLSAQLSVALQNARLLSDLNALFLGTVKSLSSAIDAKSPWTAGHSANVTRLAMQIGKKMLLSGSDLKNLELGSLLHDIGKLGTYESILDKPGKLTDEEYTLLKAHPSKGAEILSPIAQLKSIIPAIKHHHEHYNGKGYPAGLSGNQIPLMARIICVADSVDAMTSDRPYRKGRPRDQIIDELKKESGIQFDPEVVKVFLEIY